MKLSELSTIKLHEALVATESAIGCDSVSARTLREELSRRQSKPAAQNASAEGHTEMGAPEVYDYLCSIGHLIDSLSIENIKCHHANESILAERRKATPDTAAIATAEWRARTSGEQRVRLRDEINRRLAEAIARGGIRTAQEVRTYDLRGIGNGG